MSSNKLNVAKIPANIPLSYFQGIFAQLPGFKSAHYMFTPDKQQISHGVVEFASPEHAQEAIRLAQGYRIPGSSEPLYLYLDDVQGVQGYPYSLKQQQSQQQQSQQHPKMVQMVAGGHQLRPGQGFQQAGQLQYPGGRMPMQQMVYMDSMMKQNQGKSFPGGEMDPNHSMVAGMHPQYAQQTMGVIPHMQPQELEYGKMFQVPQEATNCLYIEGVPIDSKEREVAHIFRPYPGFICARLIKKEAKNGRRFYYCFVDFENKVQSTIARQTLQGYRFHYKDKRGLKISYAPPTSHIQKRRNQGSS